MYVGAELDAIENWPSLVKRSSEVVPIPVSARATAGMFLPNLQTWRGQTFIERNHEAREIDALERDLRALAASRDEPASITFGRRRLLLVRTGL